MKALAYHSITSNEQLFYHANYLLPYSGAVTGIIRALDEGVEMNFVNDEHIHEFIITIPRKVEDEPANELASTENEPPFLGHEPAKVGRNQVKEPSRYKRNQVEGERNQAEELSKDKSNQVADIATDKATDKVTDQEVDKVADQMTDQVKGRKFFKKDLTGRQKDILNFCSVPRSAQEIMDRIGIDNQTNNRKRYIQALIDLGYLMPLFPESMTASSQKYVKVKKDKY